MKHTNLILAVVSLLVSHGVACGAQQPGTQLPIQRTAPVKPVIFTCQSQVVVENISVQGRVIGPAGWSAEMPTQSQLPVKVVRHNVLPQGTMVCRYATNADPDAFKFLQLQRPSPHGKSCKPISGYRFKCQ